MYGGRISTSTRLKNCVCTRMKCHRELCTRPHPLLKYLRWNAIVLPQLQCVTQLPMNGHLKTTVCCSQSYISPMGVGMRMDITDLTVPAGLCDFCYLDL
jgi:hypothetical protein